MPRRMLATLLLLICGLAFSTTSFAQDRLVALVIGNATYKNTSVLKNPSHDAEDIAAALRELGFYVIQGLNLDYDGMRRAVLEFSRRMEGAEVGLLFYAGHGMQVSEQNYLVPVDAKLDHVRDIDLQLMELDKILTQMERETSIRIIILDACRDNPLAGSLAKATIGPHKRTKRIGKGLFEISTETAGTFAAFATRPGQVAYDGEGRNSPFTESLKGHIRKPGASITEMMAGVRKEVMSATQNKQVPWEMSSLTDAFYFNKTALQAGGGLADSGTASAGAMTEAAIRTIWDDVRAANRIQGYRAFIVAFPNSVYARFARTLIEELERAPRDATDRQEQTRAATRTMAPSPSADVAPAAAVSRRTDESQSRVSAQDNNRLRDCDLCPLMTQIEAGSFLMGSAPTEDGRQKNEGPQREVRITRPFAVSVYEVTIAEYDVCVQAKKCKPVSAKAASPSAALNEFLDARRPVTNVSWDDARDYTLWLSAQTGWQYQLLSEAEWEYVARAGSSARYSWGNEVSAAHVHCADCSDTERRKYSTVTGQHPANAFGVHDMHGNVWEWVADCWHKTYADAELSHWPWLERNLGDCGRRVLRGGSWANAASQLRSAYRLAGKTSGRGELIGFRVARVDAKQEQIVRFIEQNYLVGPERKVDEVRRHYCDSVDYYGKAGVSLNAVMEAKARYYRQWPYRSFVIIPGTLQIKPGTDVSGYLDVYFRYNFRVSKTPMTSAETRPGSRRGEARLKLRVSEQDIRVCGESGAVLAASN